MNNEVKKIFGTVVLMLFAASLLNATTFLGGGFLSLKKGDVVLIDGHKLEVKEITAVAQASGSPTAASIAFDVFNSSGTKIDSAVVTTSGYGAATSTTTESPSVATPKTETPSSYATNEFIVQAVSVKSVSGSEPERVVVSVANIAPAATGGGAIALPVPQEPVVEIPEPPVEGVFSAVVKFGRGWNLFSVPVHENGAGKIEETNCVSGIAWWYDASARTHVKAGRIEEGASLEAYKGYWFKAAAACSAKFVGDEQTNFNWPIGSQSAVQLKRVWNQIGAPYWTQPFVGVAGTCELKSGLWEYDAANKKYVKSRELEPGKGYFVKVAGDCVLGTKLPEIQKVNETPFAAPEAVGTAVERWCSRLSNEFAYKTMRAGEFVELPNGERVVLTEFGSSADGAPQASFKVFTSSGIEERLLMLKQCDYLGNVNGAGQYVLIRPTTLFKERGGYAADVSICYLDSVSSTTDHCRPSDSPTVSSGGAQATGGTSQTPRPIVVEVPREFASFPQMHVNEKVTAPNGYSVLLSEINYPAAVFKIFDVNGRQIDEITVRRSEGQSHTDENGEITINMVDLDVSSAFVRLASFSHRTTPS